MKLSFNKTRYSTRQLLSWLWSHHKGCKTQALVNMSIGLILVVASLVSVEIIRRLTEVAEGKREGELSTLAILLASVFLFELALRVVRTWVTATLGIKAQNIMQQQFFDNILRGRWSGIEKYHSGDILNRLFSDVSDIVNLMTEVLPFLVVIIVQFILSFIYLFQMDSSLAWILITVCPLFMLLSRIYFHKMRVYVRKVKDSNSAIQAIIQECIQHKMIIKVLEQGPNMIYNLERRQCLLRRQVKSRARFSIIARLVISLGFSGSYIAALTYGVFQLKDGLITAGILIAFTKLIGNIQHPLYEIARILPSLVNSMTSAERLIELEQLPKEEVGQPIYVSEATPQHIGVRFNDVQFCYKQKNRHVLDHFTFDFAPGTFTAILGPTGAGKTTLLRMMLALISPDKGTATLYDAQGEKPVSPSLRHYFSYVPQGNTLFSGTIRDNLLMGNPHATKSQMEEALRLSEAEFVFKLPDGIYTRCGEQGGGLSEGQAQRIAIARAILRPCSILLLDEATSALDIETEHRVLTNIKSHYAGTTIIFVTHRLASVSFATQELKLERNDK